MNLNRRRRKWQMHFLPVILPSSAWDAWLDPAANDPTELRSMLGSLESPDLSEHAVSTLVNKVANNLPDLIRPLETGAVGA